MQKVFKVGDRVKFVGVECSGIQIGESGIVLEVGMAGYHVQFSSLYPNYAFPHELVLLAEQPEPTLKLAPATGAVKHDKGKADLAYIPYVALVAEAEAFAVGGKKYGAFNYTQGGFTTRQLMAALIRHAYAYLRAEDRCPTDGQHHLGSVRATSAMILHLEELGVLVDDRFRHTHANGPKQGRGA